MNNPLLDAEHLPLFEQIQPDQIEPAIDYLLQQNRQQIDQLQQLEQVNWSNFIEPLELIDDRLSRAWSPVRHLNSVKNNETLRDTYTRILPKLSAYSTEVSQNRQLFEAYLKLANSDDFSHQDEARKKTISDALLHFRLGGVDLEGEDKQRYQEIQQRLSQLTTEFENNVLDATQSWSMQITDVKALSGLPEYGLELLKQNATQKDLQGYRLTLDMPSYIAVITYADDRELRETLYRAYVTRASDQVVTDAKFDNSDIMVEILQQRQQKARLLGFQHYAELSLQTKMAESTQQVTDFLQQLAEKARPAAKREFEELKAFAREQGLQDELQAWDVAYYSEKLKQQRYAIRDEDLKPYFSDQRVIEGLFQLVQQLYQVSFEDASETVERWHPDVRFYRIRNHDGNVIAAFYLDLYAREAKRGGAWMDECVNRYVIQGKTQIPVAYLTCNLTPPVDDQPALFTHDEVITLFHEFGHGLHHMLTLIDVPEVAGINGVEWDAVELPSQFMENFCWQRQALDLFARHYQSGEILPDELFDKMTRAKNFQSAMQTLRQVEFSLFDMMLHQQTEIASAEQVQHILNEVRQQVAVLIPPEFNKFQNSFTHIFAGGYAAGYYSYKWAEVLSADAFSAFEEEGLFNPATGRRFLECVLQQGGSRPAMDSFTCFRGRQPDIRALLRHNGIEQ